VQAETRQKAVIENIIASHRLEGVDLGSEVIADMERAAKGDITTSIALERAIERFKNGNQNETI